MSELKDLRRKISDLSAHIDRLSGDQVTLLFKDFAEEYLKTKLASPVLRQSTKDSFENQVRNHLIPRFGALPLERVTNAEFVYWVNETRQKPDGITRFFNSRKVLIEILTAARNDGHIEKLPKLDNPDAPKNVGRVLEDSEVLAILWHSRRPFRFIFYTLWKMGCRPREVLNWQWSMIRWNEPGKTWIDIPAIISKTDRFRSIPLNPGVSRRLYTRYQRRNDSKFVFPSRKRLDRPQITYQSAWDTACARAKVKDAVVYDFRRTAITRWAADGKPTLYISKLLDTSVAMVEKVYAKSQAAVLEEIIK